MKDLIMFAIIGIILAISIALIRLIKGPTAPDRVIAGDTLANFLVVLLVLISLLHGGASLLDLAITIAILGLVGVLAISKYLEGRGVGD